ncbi:MAG: ectonucleotide pyrophosphatase/phosphodiesterase [Clostridium sp.]|nr:ectonucleotide pyrophosphatase/phosphodiesterase [Clostridium sp.]
MKQAGNRRRTGETAKRPKRRMMILSFDAVGAEDLTVLKKLPNFRRLLEQGALCGRVESVYPSITYPAHSTIITGKKPCRHGVINNTCFQPKREHPDWMSDRKNLKGITLYDAAMERGDRVCALLWPVTGKSGITYNFPEIHAGRPWQNVVLKTIMDGSPRYVLSLLPHALRELKGIREPELDNFLEKAAVDTILRYNPELMLIHFLDVDAHRHRLGVTHPEVRRALKRLDERIGVLTDALVRTRAGDCHSMEDTTIVILGDHYQLDCHTVLYPNYLLKKQGLLQTDDRGRITDYQVVAKNCDGSCYLYLHPQIRKSANMTQKMTQKLTTIFREMTGGIARIFSGEEAAALGADDTCVMMLEAKNGYYFLDDCQILTCSVDDVVSHKMKATHGYLPTLPKYQTFFLMSGYGVKKGGTCDSMKLWDEAPTLARIMGLTLPDTDGCVKTELLDPAIERNA